MCPPAHRHRCAPDPGGRARCDQSLRVCQPGWGLQSSGGPSGYCAIPSRNLAAKASKAWRGQPSGGAEDPKLVTRGPLRGSGIAGAGLPNCDAIRSSCASTAATSPRIRSASVRSGVLLEGPPPPRSSSMMASRLVRFCNHGSPRAQRRPPRGTRARCRRGLRGDQPTVALMGLRPAEQCDERVTDGALGLGAVSCRG